MSVSVFQGDYSIKEQFKILQNEKGVIKRVATRQDSLGKCLIYILENEIYSQYMLITETS